MNDQQNYIQPDTQATVLLTLDDGRMAQVRHMRLEDSALLERMFYRLSAESLRRRFFTPVDRSSAEQVHDQSQRLATINPRRQVALIAVHEEEDGEEALAVARFVLLQPSNQAEASIIVRDDFQGVGLGRRLFELLLQNGIARGVRHLILLTQADNTGMIGLIHSLGMPYKGQYQGGFYEVDLQLGDGEEPVFPFSTPAK